MDNAAGSVLQCIWLAAMDILEIATAVGVGLVAFATGLISYGRKRARSDRDAPSSDRGGRRGSSANLATASSEALVERIQGVTDRQGILESEMRAMRDTLIHTVSDEEFSTHIAVVNTTLMELQKAISELVGEVRTWRNIR